MQYIHALCHNNTIRFWRFKILKNAQFKCHFEENKVYLRTHWKYIQAHVKTQWVDDYLWKKYQKGAKRIWPLLFICVYLPLLLIIRLHTDDVFLSIKWKINKKCAAYSSFWMCHWKHTYFFTNYTVYDLLLFWSSETTLSTGLLLCLKSSPYCKKITHSMPSRVDDYLVCKKCHSMS